MTLPSPALIELAHAHGVATAFTDWRGDTATVSEHTLLAVLAALGVDASDPVAALHAKWEESWRRMLPPTVVATEGTSRWVWVHLRDGDQVQVSLLLEGGGERALRQVDHWVDPRVVDGHLVGEATFEIPVDVPLGYHTLRARSSDRSADAALIVSPAWLGLPERMGDGASWGLAAQLYSVRSRRSWGVGDLTDLTDLAVWSGSDLGADFVLVNPLHAAEPVAPLEPSPYLPSSRRFFHPLYLRVEAVREYADLAPDDHARVDSLASAVRARLADADLIDRDTAWTAKRLALSLIHSVPRSAGREIDYRAYLDREGRALREFAIWSVLAQSYENDARRWPDELRDSASPAVADFARDHDEEIGFECWLQWLLDEQLQRAQSRAVGAGMSLGAMHDLAVGVHPGGADVWRLRSSYADGIRVGAPPDPFNQLGQDWQQPPWRPDRLEESGYTPLRDMIAAVLRHAGGVRVDHIIGLFRLWWIPDGAGPSEGAYVYYDHEAMIGVLALEAHRAGAVVVGEDLGVVDPNARSYLASRGILGTSILWFERDGDAPLPAERWREWCLASVTTHDLPPTAGYLDGEHIRLQQRLGLLSGPVDEELADAAADRERWMGELRQRGLIAEGEADVESIVAALHRYLTLTPARLLSMSLTDAVGDRRTQNQPGTDDEYPNWRIPLAGPDGQPMLLEDVFESGRVRALAAVMTGDSNESSRDAYRRWLSDGGISRPSSTAHSIASALAR